MNRVYEVSLDFKYTDTLMTNIAYKQYDYGTSFMSLKLTFGGQPANLGNDTIVAVFKSAKGKVILDNNNKPSKAFGYVFNSQGGVAIQIPKEVLDSPGRCICEVVTFANGNIRKTTQAFAFQVVSSITDLKPVEPPVGFDTIVGNFLCGEAIVGYTPKSITNKSSSKYEPTLWINGITPVNAVNMNKIESELQRLASGINSIDSVKVSYETAADSSIKSVKDALDKLLYVPLTANFTANKGSLNEKGSVLSNLILTWSYNKSIITQQLDGQSLSVEDRSKSYTTLNTNKTYTLVASDGKTNINKSLGFSFVYPIYIGDVNNSTPTQEQIKLLTKRVVNPSSQNYTYNISNKRMCIAVPSNWTIRSIIDPNNFDIYSSFTRSNLNITCLDGSNQSYKLYISEPTSQSNFAVRFNI